MGYVAFTMRLTSSNRNSCARNETQAQEELCELKDGAFAVTDVKT